MLRSTNVYGKTVTPGIVHENNRQSFLTIGLLLLLLLTVHVILEHSHLFWNSQIVLLFNAIPQRRSNIKRQIDQLVSRRPSYYEFLNGQVEGIADGLVRQTGGTNSS